MVALSAAVVRAGAALDSLKLGVRLKEGDKITVLEEQDVGNEVIRVRFQVAIESNQQLVDGWASVGTRSGKPLLATCVRRRGYQVLRESAVLRVGAELDSMVVGRLRVGEILDVTECVEIEGDLQVHCAGEQHFLVLFLYPSLPLMGSLPVVLRALHCLVVRLPSCRVYADTPSCCCCCCY